MQGRVWSMIVGALASTAFVEGAARAGQPLASDPRVDVPIVVFASAAAIIADAHEENFAPLRCVLCEGGIDRVNVVDRKAREALRWSNGDRAAAISDVLAYRAVPLLSGAVLATVAALDGESGQTLVDLLLVAEATAVTTIVMQAVKFGFGRERPYLAARSAGERAEVPHPIDANLSFASGHTSLVFALAASTSTVASLRRYRGAAAVWAVGFAAGVATGYLRIAADRHYLTDVLVGGFLGAGLGSLIPILAHPRRSGGVAGASLAIGALPLPRGGGLTLSGAF